MIEKGGDRKPEKNFCGVPLVLAYAYRLHCSDSGKVSHVICSMNMYVIEKKGGEGGKEGNFFVGSHLH